MHPYYSTAEGIAKITRLRRHLEQTPLVVTVSTRGLEEQFGVSGSDLAAALIEAGYGVTRWAWEGGGDGDSWSRDRRQWCRDQPAGVTL